MSDRTDGSALAGGLIAAKLMDKLVAKGILTVDDARDVVDACIKALALDIQTPAGYAASQVFQGMLVGQYSKRRP